MTVRYVGPGGNDGSNGTSWATRKLTLNGVEDTPVAAGDTVYVAPGVYRELLTLDVSGNAGTPITYIGDVTGEHTDGVGGIVRITGADAPDTSATRANCITASTKTYRTFQGFTLDTTTGVVINLAVGSANAIIQDCFFGASLGHSISVGGLAQSTVLIQRCVFAPGSALDGIIFTHTAVVDNAAHTVQNCLFLLCAIGVSTIRVGGITIKNCTFSSRSNPHIGVGTALTVGQTVTVNNCILCGAVTALVGTVSGEIIENYNTFYSNGTDRMLTATGANSVTYPPLFTPPMLVAGFRYPWTFAALMSWSAVHAIAGTGEAADDLFGATRPTTAAKKSWGAIQFPGTLRSSAQAHAGTYSLSFPDAGSVQFLVPTTAVSTTISVYCYREPDYTGTNPTMVIKQPGVTDRTTTDAGAAAGWNLLTDTFTPAASPGYVVVELKSLNTAAAGAYVAYFDDLVVT